MSVAPVKIERRLTGYRSDTTVNTNYYQPQLLTDDEDDIYEEYNQDSDEQSDSDQDNDDDDDDAGSELSIPDPNINFDMVYAYHTFAATVEGQASVIRGDPLTLLDDSNSYWWLVKVLKTSMVGYIPAENIETPYERLARLNSHRNIEITKKDIQDAFPIPPSLNKKKTKRVTLAKDVQYQSLVIYGLSENEEEEEEGEEEQEFETEFEQWDEKMQSEDSDSDSDDPYDYYNDTQNYSDQQQAIDMYSESYTAQNLDDESDSNYDETIGMNSSVEEMDYYHQDHVSDESDIINDENTFKLKKVAKFENLLAQQELPTEIKIYMNHVGDYQQAEVYSTTTTLNLIHQLAGNDDNYLVVKTMNGDELTLNPTDKPLEIFQSLTAHLNTPMPSLKKAKRISQLMGSEDINMNGLQQQPSDQIKFYLISKKPTDEGEIQIKVSCMDSNKLVKITSSMIVRDAIPFLLEKFQLPNSTAEKCKLLVSNNGKQQALGEEDRLLDMFGDHPPTIQYRRNSHIDTARTSMTTNIPAPDKNELHFILHYHTSRQNTPETYVSSAEIIPQYSPQLSLDDDDDEITEELDRPESSLFFCNDFGTNDLMIMIRGAANTRSSEPSIRTEINDLFKDNQTRLEQLEMELDRLMFNATNVYL